jgi:hypothetical protein
MMLLTGCQFVYVDQLTLDQQYRPSKAAHSRNPLVWTIGAGYQYFVRANPRSLESSLRRVHVSAERPVYTALLPGYQIGILRGTRSFQLVSGFLRKIQPVKNHSD